jgi:hypothetical protein
MDAKKLTLRFFGILIGLGRPKNDMLSIDEPREIGGPSRLRINKTAALQRREGAILALCTFRIRAISFRVGRG